MGYLRPTGKRDLLLEYFKGMKHKILQFCTISKSTDNLIDTNYVDVDDDDDSEGSDNDDEVVSISEDENRE